MEIRLKQVRKISRIVLIISLVLVSMSMLRDSGYPALAQEGDGVEPQIIDGVPVDPTDYPWMVAIVGSNQPNPAANAHPFDISLSGQFCGGSLIEPDLVLTAAHCVIDFEPEDIDIVLGVSVLYEGPTVGSKGQRISVTEIFPSPAYEVASFSDADIALLRLATPAELGPTVNTIGLVGPDDDNLVSPETMAIVTGWGATSEGGRASDTLLEVSLPIVSNAECSEAYSDLTEITSNMLCAGFVEGGKDSCNGDSGGPLIVPNGSGGFLQAGIVSFGAGCAEPAFFGVYTRVSEFESFIATVINPPVIRLSPDSLQLSIDETGTTEIQIEDAINLYGIEFNLTFDPVIVEVVDADSETSGIQIEVDPFFSNQDHVIDVNQVEGGIVKFAATLVDPAIPIEGSGSLTSITWHGLGAGSSELMLTEVKLSDPDDFPIIHSTENGLVDVIGNGESIKGTVLLQGRSDHSGTNIFLAEEPCTEAIIPEIPATVTDSAGFFEIIPMAGQSFQCLFAVRDSYLKGLHEQPIGDLGTITLRGGDVNADNIIDISDLAFIASRINTTDQEADINADGLVDIFDLALVANNFGVQGPKTDWETVSETGIVTISSFTE